MNLEVQSGKDKLPMATRRKNIEHGGTKFR